MKVLKIDYGHYLYPEYGSDLDSFMEYVNASYRFIHLTKLCEDNCVPPYFVEEDTCVEYINFDHVRKISEVEVTILSRKGYDERLTECMAKFCMDCIRYKENEDGDNLEGHRESMSLDGVCHYKKN